MFAKCIRVVGQAWRASLQAPRISGVLTVVALLVAACGGSPSSAGSGGSPDAAGASSSPSAVAFAACMHSHGVPNYPGPDSHGNLRKTSVQELGVSVPEFNAAKQACQHPLPSNSGGSFEQQAQQCEDDGVCPHPWCSRC
jgi:hypothetical protein